MLVIKVYADPKMSVDRDLWIELSNGLPVHPCDFPQRIMDLVRLIGLGYYRDNLATVNHTALGCLSMLVRTRQLEPPIRVVIVHKDGSESENEFCLDGEFLKPWGEKQEDCQGFTVEEAHFYFRYGR